MAIDLPQLDRTIQAHGPVARVVVADTSGSTPREVGAAMLVWDGGQSGTIGGGELEYRAAQDARAQLKKGRPASTARLPLGPALGQCCGGAVTIVTEIYQAEDVARLADLPIHARAVSGPDNAPLAVTRAVAHARNQGVMPPPEFIQGWMVEPVARPQAPVWIYGAGHVGSALVHTLSPLPDLAITWIDVDTPRFPDDVPEGVTCLPAPDPTKAVSLAPADAHHLVLTYSHVMDLEICHAILSHKFASAGLIGSATKWARFRKRLVDLGHGCTIIDQIDCPIGDPSLGKHPQAIALGVATALVKCVAQKNNHDRGRAFDRGYAP
ncbi:molybdenum cofactor sulfurylase [Aliiroseovarius halocynthiae]|uniref:Xanthine dehydrogenase accessory protein XdhC n=1 Tax=Aliiroseovarius halocynthiae TaxID=985055 RepID=A0A545SRI7_9RHOB|nr:xanthine dehydrogenase accessory protein XdhC [Aliiroseovarius halocynthiae]TQV67591.1 xanthine dehydrogenase accessory protein XdhC [Aliiroseovarius halocynthiae]SMR81609.1 molybdenum cofactor sulfurylase [Aliiroseovarius halocynthiae]